MRVKQRHITADLVADAEQQATLKQLEKILAIRKNRKEKHEAKTRELRRALEDKQHLLQEETAKSKAFDQQAREDIKQLNAARLNTPMSIKDVLHWSAEEVSIKKSIERSYARCDEIQDQLDHCKFKLDSHLKLYKQAVIDYEKILIIKQEIELQREA
jgi:hypothetical protein